MATRSEIYLEKEDGTFDYVYCHWDGYPEWNGRILLKHYNDVEKVKALISLGSISSLGVDPTLPINMSEDGDVKVERDTDGFSPYVIDYHRWRNEELVIGKSDKPQCHEEYSYIYKKDSSGEYKWYILTDEWGAYSKEPVLLTTDIARNPDEGN